MTRLFTLAWADTVFHFPVDRVVLVKEHRIDQRQYLAEICLEGLSEPVRIWAHEENFREFREMMGRLLAEVRELGGEAVGHEKVT